MRSQDLGQCKTQNTTWTDAFLQLQQDNKHETTQLPFTAAATVKLPTREHAGAKLRPGVRAWLVLKSQK